MDNIFELVSRNLHGVTDGVQMRPLINELRPQSTPAPRYRPEFYMLTAVQQENLLANARRSADRLDPQGSVMQNEVAVARGIEAVCREIGIGQMSAQFVVDAINRQLGAAHGGTPGDLPFLFLTDASHEPVSGRWNFSLTFAPNIYAPHRTAQQLSITVPPFPNPRIPN